ncbi:ribonuclease H protein [Trifolium medium]|uniref:Ribonuclease H protein n=1 Tax=Trifolium medium TaxID=97028 RepID=A0A392NBH5_9FABA|nr:ribonuclease H protein [Trifolium medium]
MLLKDRVIRKRNIIQHHISSSIWSSIKEEFSVITDNTFWLLGNGEEINFWNDNWCGSIMADHFNVPNHLRKFLSSTVRDYIFNGQWNFPPQMHQHLNNLVCLVQKVTIPLEASQDKLLWKHSDTGELQLNEAYQFKLQQFQDLNWAKAIWNSDIPPSKSLLVWRLMHNKIPTDENLKLSESSAAFYLYG